MTSTPDLRRELTGTHHEIYIGYPRRSAAERLKTTLRFGVTAEA